MKKIMIISTLISMFMSQVVFSNVESVSPRTDVAFVLVYMSTCPHCQRFDPILKQYVVSHHIPTLAYTLNGISLPSFKNSITPTQAELNKLFPNGNPVVPSLFVVDRKHHQIIRALTGEASGTQLNERMIQVEQYMLEEGKANV